MDGKWLHVHDAHTGQEIASTATEGRGPGVVIMALDFTLDRQTGMVTLLDTQQKLLAAVQVDSLVQKGTGPVTRQDSTLLILNGYYALPDGCLTFDQFAYAGTHPKSRYTRT